MTHRRTLTLVTALGTGAVLALAAPAIAAHDGNPSDRVERYSYDLDAVQDGVPGTGATGTTRITALPNGRLQVRVEASGLAPGLPHAMHLHDTTGADRSPSSCPGEGADADGDGVVTVLEGAPSYGGIVVSLTTTGDTSPASGLALDRFPVADADGTLSYSRTFAPADPVALAQAGSVQVVVHGADFDGNGAYAFGAGPFASKESSIAAGVPLEATVPVLCGGIAN
jgi:hypothetical protein